MHRANGTAPALLAALAIVSAGLAGAACRKQSTPAVDVQTQTPAQATNQPVTLTGCLRAGEADETFVLTTAEAAGATKAATYQLLGRPDLNLRTYVGRQVEVGGVVKAAQQTATTQPARPTGTSGTGKVETQTVVDIKSLDVDTVKPLTGSCPK